MPEFVEIAESSLVLYKNRPARVVRAGERLEIELENGPTVRVRTKDVVLLHPGPLASLRGLQVLTGEIYATWEILAGQETTLADLAELAYGEFSPASAWAAWQVVTDGLYFSGWPDKLHAAWPEEVQAQQAARAAKLAEENAWAELLARVRSGMLIDGDRRFFHEVEQLAYGLSQRARLLKDLNRPETPENAHALLLELGIWTEQVDPYPRRLGLPVASPDLPVPALPDEPRRDLTALPAFAIDDAGTDNPDDALSLEGQRIWVHVADPAALVEPGSPLDVEALGRGMTLHLPEGVAHLFPADMTARLGLGLQEISPALSFGIDLDGTGQIRQTEIVPSWVKVQRMTYEEANLRMDEPLFAALEKIALLRRQKRLGAGAVDIDLPEVKLHVQEGLVQLSRVLSLRSRLLVEEAMLLAGEAVASFGIQHGIPLPFSTQDSPDERLPMGNLAEQFALRRQLKRSQHRVTPAPHSGLGLPAYVQATSPLRRVLDLTAHQQLRAFLAGRPLMDGPSLLERIGSMEAVQAVLRQAESQANRHWTLVYLRQHPDWRGEGVAVEKRGSQVTLLVPDLAFETRMSLPMIELNQRVSLAVSGIQLAQQEVIFRWNN